MSLPNNPNFRVVGVEDDDPPPSPQPSPQEHAVAIKMLQVALSALWSQFVVAVAHMFTFASVASVFVLYLLAPSDPSTRQLVLLGMYGTIILLANGLVIWSRRK